MENIPDDELISAYLDGELTGQDLARAEQLLASQPDSRQMLEELTALRASLKSLPQHKLGPDFAESVLRRAEREMLQPGVTGVSAAEAGGPALPDPAATWKAEVPPILSMSRWTRPLIWSALATAAAIAVMMFSPPDAPNKVAMGPAPQANGQQDAVAQNGVQRFEAQAIVAPDNEAIPTIGAANTTADARATDGIASDEAKSQAAGGMGGGGQPAIAATRSATSGFYAGQAAATGRGLADQGAAPFAARSYDGDATLLVVRCDVTPEVARSASFRRLLAEHQIPWQEAAATADAAGAKSAAEGAADTIRDVKDASALAATKEKDDDRALRAKKGDSQASVARAAADRKAESPGGADKAPAIEGAAPPAPANATGTHDTASNAEAVYVIATPSQVNATVAAITSSADFRNVQTRELAVPLPIELFGAKRASNGAKTSDADAADNAPPAAIPPAAGAGDNSPAVASPAAAAAPAFAGERDKPGESANQNFFDKKQQMTAPGEPAPQVLGSNVVDISSTIAQPVVAHAAPAALSTDTIAELSRAFDNPAADSKSNTLQSQFEVQPSDEAATGDKRQLSTGEPSAQDPQDVAGSQKNSKPLSAIGAAKASTGTTMPTDAPRGAAKPTNASGGADAPGRAYSAGTKSTLIPPSAPGPVSAPAPAPLAESVAPPMDSAAKAGEAKRNDKSALGAMGKPAKAEASKDAYRLRSESTTRDNKQGGAAAPTEERETMQKQEAPPSAEGVAPKQVIFLFRIVPAPDAAP